MAATDMLLRVTNKATQIPWCVIIGNEMSTSWRTEATNQLITHVKHKKKIANIGQVYGIQITNAQSCPRQINQDPKNSYTD